MALTTLVAGNTITAAGLNDNFSFCVLTDTAKTISVTHTYSASQTFTGGWTAATTCTITATSGTLLSLRYDGSNHLAVTVDSAGAVTYNATGTGPHHVFADRMVFNGALRLTTDPTASPEAAINITTGFSLATGTTQIGVNVNPVYSSAATVAGYGVYGKVQTAVASFTMTSAMSFYAANPTAGAGSTITSAYGVYVEAITTGGTNNYAIYTNAGLVSFGGAVTATTTLTVTSTFTANATAYINDTANTFMSMGLTINQGANDNEILAFKSSDVAHGVTTIAEDDTYGTFGKANATLGGTRLWGLSESEIGVQIFGTGASDDTGKTTSGNGYIELTALKKSGTTIGAVGTDANMVVIRDNDATTRFIFDAEGSGHADVEWVAF